MGLGGLFFIITMVHLLEAVTGLPLWACYGIVGTLLAVGGFILVKSAMKLSGTVHALPVQTIQTMKEDARWIKEQLASNKTVKDIVHTRVAIAEKLEMLEQQVEQKMERSKIAVRDLVDHTAGVVGDMVHKTKQTLDPLHQFGERPWVMLGGAVMLGYLAGMLEARLRSSGVYPYYTGDAPHEAPVMPSSQQDDEPRPGVYPYYPEQAEPSEPEDRTRLAEAAWPLPSFRT